jgi:hypothetical protein
MKRLGFSLEMRDEEYEILIEGLGKEGTHITDYLHFLAMNCLNDIKHRTNAKVAKMEARVE